MTVVDLTLGTDVEKHISMLRKRGVRISTDPPSGQALKELVVMHVRGLGVLGLYDVQQDSIHIQPTAPCSVVYHELAHWSGHPSRLGRPCARHQLAGHAVTLRSQLMRDEETLAQMVGQLFAQRYGLAVVPEHCHDHITDEAHMTFEWLIDHLGLV